MNLIFYPVNKAANLGEAQFCLGRLLPHLPWPCMEEWMDPCGLDLSRIGLPSSTPPFIEHPTALIGTCGDELGHKLPGHWKLAHDHHRQRQQRNAELIRLLPTCRNADNNEGYVPEELDGATDGLVAGVLHFAINPVPGPMRAMLSRLARTHWWGAFAALHSSVFADEIQALLKSVANDPRLSASVARARPDLSAPLIESAMGRTDIWSASLALTHPLSAEWVFKVRVSAAHNPLAAVTALALQPAASRTEHAVWIQRLRQGPPRLAYLAVRHAQHTWPARAWETLRDTLRDSAMSDAQARFHWLRDVEPQRIHDALRSAVGTVLWQAELIQQARHSGKELQHRMRKQLQKPSANRDQRNEAELTLRWLARRKTN
jgi:hypothetical protein